MGEEIASECNGRRGKKNTHRSCTPFPLSKAGQHLSAAHRFNGTFFPDFSSAAFDAVSLAAREGISRVLNCWIERKTEEKEEQECEED